MKHWPLTLLVLCAPTCWSQSTFGDDESRGAAAVHACIAESRRLAPEIHWTAIDRAYVRLYRGEIGVLFAHGEVGTFGIRSPDYHSGLGCHLLDTEGLRVVFMADTLKEPVVGKEQDLQEIYSRTRPAEANGEAVELLFLRNGDRFEFSRRQVYSDRNLFRHNPELGQG